MRASAPRDCEEICERGERKVAVSKATWKRKFKLPWGEVGSLNYLDDKVDSDQ